MSESNILRTRDVTEIQIIKNRRSDVLHWLQMKKKLEHSRKQSSSPGDFEEENSHKRESDVDSGVYSKTPSSASLTSYTDSEWSSNSSNGQKSNKLNESVRRNSFGSADKQSARKLRGDDARSPDITVSIDEEAQQCCHQTSKEKNISHEKISFEKSCAGRTNLKKDSSLNTNKIDSYESTKGKSEKTNVIGEALLDPKIQRHVDQLSSLRKNIKKILDDGD